MDFSRTTQFTRQTMSLRPLKLLFAAVVFCNPSFRLLFDKQVSILIVKNSTDIFVMVGG